MTRVRFPSPAPNEFKHLRQSFGVGVLFSGVVQSPCSRVPEVRHFTPILTPFRKIPPAPTRVSRPWLHARAGTSATAAHPTSPRAFKRRRASDCATLQPSAPARLRRVAGGRDADGGHRAVAHASGAVRLHTLIRVSAAAPYLQLPGPMASLAALSSMTFISFTLRTVNT